MTARPHDAFFKETFSNLDNARGELRSILPPEVSALIDWSTLRLETGTFVDEALRETLTDLLFTVQMHGREVRLYLLFEHQSSPDPLMPFRALAYVVRIWDQWLVNRGGPRLPPVIPVLLAQVEDGWTCASDLLSIIDFTDDAERAVIGPFVPQCRLLVDDLAHVTNSDLDARPLPDEARLALAALRDVRTSKDIETTIRRWRRWLRTAINIPPLVRYILYARPKTKVEELARVIGSIEPRHEESVMSTAAELVQQGVTKGKADGKAEGKAETLLLLLRLRFGALPASVDERVRAADLTTLDRLAARVLTATSIDEVFAD